MSKRFVQPGEILRIRSRGLVLELRPGASYEVRILKRGPGVRFARALLASWLRLHRFGRAAARGYLRRRREDAAARFLAQLDARLLKDIGLEAHHGSFLAERIHAYRRAEALRGLL